MASRLGWFVLGSVGAIVALGAGTYLYIRAGGVPMATSAAPLPFEAAIAGLALRASYGDAAQRTDPLPLNEVNLLAGTRQYTEHCAACHGTPHMPAAIAKGMYPPPPQLFEQTVTDDPEGITYWTVTNGIRMTGMPAFQSVLSDTERWQVTMLLAHADALPASVVANLSR
jgi:thiosulfate dehydrogenase